MARLAPHESATLITTEFNKNGLSIDRLMPPILNFVHTTALLWLYSSSNENINNYLPLEAVTGIAS